MTDTIKKELKLIEKAAREFARKALLPNREETDRYPFENFFHSPLEAALDVDFFHLNLPEEYGGIGRNVTPLCVVLQNLCEVDASMGSIIFTNAFSQEMFFESGDTGLLKDITSTKKDLKDFLIAFPIFNHPGEIEPTVIGKKEGENYSVTGNVEQLALGNIANHCLIPGKISGEEHPSLFYINLKSQGVQISDPLLNLGLRSCPCIDLTLDHAKAVLVGEKEKACVYFSNASKRMRLLGAAMSNGIMIGSLNEALSYCRERDQGGRKIVDWSEVQIILADMAIKTNTSKMLLAHACESADTKTPQWDKEADAAAISIQNAACRVTTDGVQLLGGSGYMKDYGQEKRFRDAKQLQALLGIAPLKKISYLKTIL